MILIVMFAFYAVTSSGKYKCALVHSFMPHLRLSGRIFLSICASFFYQNSQSKFYIFSYFPFCLWWILVLFHSSVKNWSSRPLFHLFLVFFKQTLQFLLQIDVKNAHPVYATGIRTHAFRTLASSHNH